jgi:translocation and assembly module TamA
LTAAALCALALAGCGTLLDGEGAGDDRDSALSGPLPVSYTATIDGLDEQPDVREVIRASLDTFRYQQRGAPSIAGLKRRAENDRATLMQVMSAEAHYDATVEIRVEETPGDPDADARAIFDVAPGTAYTIAAFQPAFEPHPEELPTDAEIKRAADLGEGAEAHGEDIVAAETRVVRFLSRNGFPYARFIDRRAVANTENHTLTVTARFDPGPYTTFGPLVIEGDTKLARDYIMDRIPWQEGEPYDRQKVEKFQEAMRATGLFDAVSVQPPQTPDPEQVARPITLKVADAKLRSISGGLRYDTDLGPGARIAWRHRNLFGGAEDFRAELDASLKEQKLTFGMTQPHTPTERWTLKESFTLRRLDDDAFSEESATARIGVETGVGEHWRVGTSVEASAAKVESDIENDTAYLLGFPTFANLDRANDQLNATEGFRLFLAAAPYAGLNNGDPAYFGRISLGGAFYQPLIGENSLVLALRARVATILSQALDDVPVNERFFAGGGASVRGYEFQSISPTNDAGELTGGRFLSENAIELRARFMEDLGVVAFVDTGYVAAEPFPDATETLHVGVGGGVRYYSPVGPIRFDLAFPLHRRDEDNFFEFYISLGQAF